MTLYITWTLYLNPRVAGLLSCDQDMYMYMYLLTHVVLNWVFCSLLYNSWL